MIPSTLWEKSKEVLNMPPSLADVYKNFIFRHKLDGLADRVYDDSPVGGITLEETNKHLAQAFDGSSARVQLAVLDPKNETNGTSDAFIKCLSGNKLVIVDAPCGAGAATLTFLSTISELRKKKVLPRIPLDVVLIGAEIAESARKYAQELIDEIQIDFEKQAIFVKYQFNSWDVTSQVSTADLIKNIIKSGDGYPKNLVVIANFSGFLKTKKKEANPQIEELLRYSAGESSLAIWIEPQTNPVVKQGGIFQELAKWTVKNAPFMEYLLPYPKNETYATSSAHFRRPINSENTPRVHLAVMSFNLKRAYDK